MDRLKALIESRGFELIITWLIVINAVTLGLETSPALLAQHGAVLHFVDHVLLGVFVVELVAKMLVYRAAFFRDPWRIFDFLVVGISLLPASGALSILRALRVLRVLRLVSIIPSMRRVVGGLFQALPSMGSIFLLLMLVFYVFAVMATKLYGADFPVYFGNIAASAFTLFQVMTLEGWAAFIPSLLTVPSDQVAARGGAVGRQHDLRHRNHHGPDRRLLRSPPAGRCHPHRGHRRACRGRAVPAVR